MDQDIIRRQPAKDYERPEDRIPLAGQGPAREPVEVRGASNQQHDLGPVSPPKTTAKEER